MSSDRQLELTRPLIVFDLETTGLDTSSDRIVELGLVRLLPGGERSSRSWLVHPGQPIPAAASAVHGIRDEDVAGSPRWEDIAVEVFDCFAGCDVSGFNVERFDLPLLVREFQRAEIEFPSADIGVVDSFSLFVRREPRDLAAAVSLYCGRDHAGAHRAVADAEAAADVLLGQLRRYQDLPQDVSGLARECRRRDPSWVDAAGKLAWVGEEVVLTFGKHAQKSLRTLVAGEPDYLAWVLGADFPEDTKTIIAAALEGQFPVPEGSSSRD